MSPIVICSKALQGETKMNLPELKGTEKQISWANTIRNELTSKIPTPETIAENLVKNVKPEQMEAGKVISDEYAVRYAKVFSEDNAGEWINKRTSLTYASVLRYLTSQTSQPEV